MLREKWILGSLIICWSVVLHSVIRISKKMERKFNLNEIVKVFSKKGRTKEISSRQVVITGMSQSEEDGRWAYSIDFPELSWCFFEDKIKSIGQLIPQKIYP